MTEQRHCAISTTSFFTDKLLLVDINTLQITLPRYKVNQNMLRGYCTHGPYFCRLYAFIQKKQSNFGQSFLWIWLEIFQGTQKSQFSFSRDHCCEVAVKHVQKSIFSMF